MPPADARGLFFVLEQVTGPRGRQAQRHTFNAMLAAIICATLCGVRETGLPNHPHDHLKK